jgi:peptide deformylase
MIETMQAADGIGLAAPQVAKSVALIVVDLGLIEQNAKPVAFLNPEIYAEIGSVTIEEGCLSVPEIREEVTRAERIQLRYQPIDGEEIETWLEGLAARVVLHEIDHLNGVFFVDRIGALKKRLINKELKNIVQDELQNKKHAA